jgi:hypothetical protein
MTTKSYLRISLLLITFGLLISCSNSNDWNRRGLNGKIKTYLERTYEAEKKFGEWGNGDIEYYGHNRVSFDSDGNYQYVEYFNENNELSGKLIPNRENGDLIEEAYYDKDGELNSKRKIIHNSKDELESIFYNEDGEITAQGKTYYANDRVIKLQYQTFEDNEVKEEYTVVFEYDKDGNMASQKQMDKKGEITHFLKFKYLAFDENKNWTKRLDYDSEEGEEPKNIVIREYKYY